MGPQNISPSPRCPCAFPHSVSDPRLAVPRLIEANKGYDIGQKLWEGYHGVMLGTRAITWATNKKVGPWQTLAYTVAETNYEYISLVG